MGLFQLRNRRLSIKVMSRREPTDTRVYIPLIPRLLPLMLPACAD